MKTLPLTVLYYEGPIARAYLEVMRRQGFRPHTILRISPPPGVLARLLPGAMRRDMAAARNERFANHWPRMLARRFPELCAEMTVQIEGALQLGAGFVASLRDGRRIDAYANRIHNIELQNLKDPALLGHLARHAQSPILFTGGGILPRAVFDISGIRLLHIHPGLLPHVKGADGLLWSTLVRGRPGISAFLMAPGLDTGDVLDSAEPEPLAFRIPENEHPNDDDLYRMIFSFYDPSLRAQKLSSVLRLLDKGSELYGTPQEQADGLTYHFMDVRTRHKALSLLFGRNEDPF